MSIPTFPTFLQDPPRIGNQYLEDSAMRSVLERLVPADILQSFQPDLIRFGQRNVEDILEYGKEVESHPPKLTQYNAWGERIDHIEVSNGWKRLQDISAEEGLIAIAYERKYQEYSRVYQAVKLYLFACSSGVFGCPLAMTDGAARLLELFGTQEDKKNTLSHLLSRNPREFWTSGQWMTEKPGGSDVGNTETIAKAIPSSTDGRSFALTGYKYFTSAVTSEISLTLARITDTQKNTSVSGSKGLSCFLLDVRKPSGQLNNIVVHRLKEKLGTKAVPTAELELNGTVAKLVGPAQRGVPVIATILNITRIHNAIHSVSSMRRGIAVARDYASRRSVFGKKLADQPLHLQTLSEMEIQFRGCLQLLMDVALLQGKAEVKKASQEDDSLLRILTPLLKLYAGKQSIGVVSESLESLGGNGYMEDGHLPVLLRDVQVTSIWEGTTNVLSLDVWRPIRSADAFTVFIAVIKRKLDGIKKDSLRNQSVPTVRAAVEELEALFARYLSSKQEILELTARHWAFSLSRVYIAALLLEQANWEKGTNIDVEVANRWCLDQVLVPKNIFHFDASYGKETRNIALDIDPTNNQPRGSGDKMADGTPRARF